MSTKVHPKALWAWLVAAGLASAACGGETRVGRLVVITSSDALIHQDVCTQGMQVKVTSSTEVFETPHIEYGTSHTFVFSPLQYGEVVTVDALCFTEDSQGHTRARIPVMSHPDFELSVTPPYSEEGAGNYGANLEQLSQPAPGVYGSY